MDPKKLLDLQGWAAEKFTDGNLKLASLARMPGDLLTAEEVEMLSCAREGWLVGLEEGNESAHDYTHAVTRLERVGLERDDEYND